MIYLDTHVVVWLYAGITEKFSEVSKTLINKNELFVSPMLLLELQYMYEIDRINVRPDEVISDMSHRLGLRVCDKNFASIVEKSLQLGWTQDPFDRIIVANALSNQDLLVTKDSIILQHYPNAKW